MYHTQLTISCLIYCVIKFISSEFTHYDAADYELKLLRLTTTDIWYSQRNHIFEIDLRNRSKARLILKWPSDEAARCSGIFSNCIGYIIYAVELKSGVFEICGILQKIATCSIYKYVGNYLKAISEERLANELINSDQDSTLFYHTNDSLMLLKQELDELPLILVRKLNSAAFSRSDAYHKMDAFWWRKQLLSRLPSVSGSLPMSIHALFHHKQHGYILYGEVKQNAHEADIFTRALNAAENMATYIARFCINDEGLQMPGDGRFILTALFRLTLLCSRKVKSHRENLDTFQNFRKNSVKTTPRQINFGKLMLSTTSHSMNGEMIITGLFTYSSKAEVDFAGQIRMSASPMALCSFRLSDIEETLENSELLLPWRYFGSKETGGQYDKFFLTRITEKKPDEDLSNDKGVRPRIIHSNSIAFPQTNGSGGSPSLTSCTQSSNDQTTFTIKSPYASQPILPESKEANAFIQSTETFVAMLVDSASNSSYPSNKEVSSRMEHRIIYVLTLTGRLLILLDNKEDIDMSVAAEQSYFSTAESMTTRTYGAVRLLFWVQILSAAKLPTRMRFLPVTNDVRQTTAAVQSLVFWNAKGILITNMSECLRESHEGHSKNTFHTKGLYFDKLKSASSGHKEDGAWRTVDLECHFPTRMEEVSLETATAKTTCSSTSFAISISFLIFGLLTILSLITLIISWINWRKAHIHGLRAPASFSSPHTQESSRIAEPQPQLKRVGSLKNSEIFCRPADDGTPRVQAILPGDIGQTINSQSTTVVKKLDFELLSDVQPMDPANFDFPVSLANLQTIQKSQIIIENQLNNDVFLQISPLT